MGRRKKKEKDEKSFLYEESIGRKVYSIKEILSLEKLYPPKNSNNNNNKQSKNKAKGCVRFLHIVPL